MKELIQTADWKSEKHVPVIKLPEQAQKGQPVQVAVTIGAEIPHPNTSEHHIAWAEVFFHPEGDKFPYLLGRFDFSAHGASVQGPNTSTVYTAPTVVCTFTTEKPGTVSALSYCNIHGLWSSAADLTLQ
ncbi:MAG: class II SORL domain-containing protein [Candidatus Marinimicrobia bacterium]|nr:class II SORL domain-containing protein [Candidatus Neomarinimicrobiota bacterium]